MNMKNRTVRATLMALCGATVAIYARAATFTATSSGDIASADFWSSLGYAGSPGDADTVALNAKATSNPFTASRDLSILNISFETSGAYINLGNPGVTITLKQAANGNGMEFKPKNSGFNLTGGTWDFTNGAYLYCGRANSGSSQINHSIMFDSTVVTNVGRFIGSYYDPKTSVTLQNGTRVHAGSFYSVYGNSTSNATFTVKGGSKMFVSENFTYDYLGSAYDPETSNVGDNAMTVTGTGSLVKVAGDSVFGSSIPSNALTVAAGAMLNVRAFDIGKDGIGGHRIVFDGVGTTNQTGLLKLGAAGGSTGNSIVYRNGAYAYNSGEFRVGHASAGNTMTLSSAMTSSGQITVGYEATASNNVLQVEGSSSMTLRGGTSLVVGRAGSGNRLDFTGGAITFVDGGFFKVGAQASATDNTVRISGGSTSITRSSTKETDPFGAGSGNLFLIEDGASVAFRCYAATNSAQNVLRVKNATFATGDHGYLGYGAASSVSNRMEILDGSSATFKCFRICSYGNELVVSNATFQADDATRGICLGYSSASNCALTVAGETARVETSGPLTFDKQSRLHFTVPEGGWSEAPVRALSLSLGKNTQITIDCAAFAARHGGIIRLVKTDNGLQNNVDSVIALANAAANLPKGGHFRVDGNDLVFACPLKGLRMYLR